MTCARAVTVGPGGGQGYLPELDGIRALAVLAVVAFHAKAPGFGGGFLGVDLFFVLSGFLIGRTLASEFLRTRTISIVGFYKRRLLRLTPALFFMLALYGVLALCVGLGEQAAREIPLAALYLTDYSKGLSGVPTYLSHTWSLSVEQHFYLAAPLVLLPLFRAAPQALLVRLLLMLVVATLWRWWELLQSFNWWLIYARFDTRLSGLLLGMSFGVIGRQLPGAAGWAGFLAVGIAMAFAEWAKLTALVGWMLLAEVGALLLILGASGLTWLRVWPLIWLGRRSYGIYLWHYPLMLWMRKAGYSWEWTLPVGSAVAIVMAEVSYRWVETRFLQKRQPGASFEDRGVKGAV